MQRLIPVVIVLLLSVPFSAGLPSLVRADTSVGGPLVRVCAVLYVWYGFNNMTGEWTGGLGTSHWNSTEDLKDTIVKDTPSSGYYSSVSDVGYQLATMQQTGINCVIVSWWGWGNFTDPSQIPLDKAINNATKQVFSEVAAMGSSFQIALLVDAFYNDSLSSPDYHQIYAYIEDNFYSPFANYILQWEGRPLVLWFNTLSFNQLKPENSTFTTRIVGNNEALINSGWYFWTAPKTYFSYGGNESACSCYYGPKISPDGFVSITPRYDDMYLYLSGARSGFMRVDYSLSGNAYGDEWKQVIQSEENASNVKLVFIYSWNEYHERSAIEPVNRDFTNATVSQSYLLHLTKENIALLEQTSTSGFPLVCYLLGVMATIGIVTTAFVFVLRRRRLMKLRRQNSGASLTEHVTTFG